MEGLFVIVDGPSATGKDTLIFLLVSKLEQAGYEVFSYEEVDAPGYDKQKILDARNTGSDEKIALAFIEERKKLYETVVKPKLKKGVIVVGNRGEPSTLVYQTLRNQIPMEKIWNLHREYTVMLPALIVLTNCSVEEAIRRDEKRNRTDLPNSLHGKFTRDALLPDKGNFAKRERIHISYKTIEKFLRERNLSVLSINTEEMNPDKAIYEVFQKIRAFV